MNCLIKGKVMNLHRGILIRFGIVLAFFVPVANAEIVFQEKFDDLADWTSTMYSSEAYQAVWLGDVLPGRWDTIYQGGYYDPPSGHASLEILEGNSDRARGGSGKSSVNWREHHINPNFTNEWKSNSALGIHLDKFGGGYNQIYVEFWVAFDPNWTHSTASSKIFRVFSWDETGDFWQAFSGGAQGPLFLWDYSFSESYGVRNKLSFRGGPHGENYQMTSEDVGDLPRELIGLGDMSANFTSDLQGATYEGDASLLDKLTGSTLQSSGTISHEQIFGRGGTWTKVAFFVKMNSAPGVRDGVFKQWIDDNLIIETNKVEWVGQNPENKMVKWNAVGIGGNDYWVNGGYSNSDQREEWYAIDDVVISTEILASDSGDGGNSSPPSPPQSVTIEQ